MIVLNDSLILAKYKKEELEAAKVYPIKGLESAQGEGSYSFSFFFIFPFLLFSWFPVCVVEPAIRFQGGVYYCISEAKRDKLIQQFDLVKAIQGEKDGMRVLSHYLSGGERRKMRMSRWW